MTNVSTADTRGSGRRGGSSRKRGNVVTRLFRAVGLFVSQIIDELRKVVRPTRHELLTYTSVVIVFVVAVMLYVSVLDFGFGKLILWVFGS
ncbi:preprotein translocase subunit SecE [Oryzihumus sp.]